MRYKEDWDRALERHKAWWEREIIDRVCISVTAPREEPSFPEPPATLTKKWTDIEYVLTCAEERIKCTYFGGDALPLFLPNLGPDVFSAFFGCPLTFAENTSWVSPIIRDWDEDIPKVRFDEGNHWWKLAKALTAAAVEWGRDKFFVELIDMHTGGDAISAMRGPQNLCMDLVERPDKVKELMERIKPITYHVYEELYGIIQTKMQGSSTWLQVWSPGRTNALQCDFIIMISPEMFREFFLEDLWEQAQWLDHSIYHLDGPGAIRHLDLLLDIPELDAIQWVPGAGAPPMSQWIPLLKRIQKANKGVHISVDPGEIEIILNELSPRGLFIQTYANTVEEADRIVALAAKMSCKKALTTSEPSCL